MLGKKSREKILLVFLVLVSVIGPVYGASAGASGGVTLRAGEVVETNVSRDFVSERWMGLSGQVYRGNESLGRRLLGQVSFNSNQSGEVLSASLEGIEGGGYYLAFLPENLDMQTGGISSLDNSSLEKGGIFSQSSFPSFYPNYSEYYDNPNKTFEYNETLRIEGEYYDTMGADLPGDADMYVLEYDHNSSHSYPLLVSPVDGMKQGKEYNSCYVSGCNFQALLPVLESKSSFSYSVYLFSRGQSVGGCGTVDTNSTSILLGSDYSEQNCLEVQDTENLHLDFYNTNLSTDSEDPGCAVNLTGAEAHLEDVYASDYSTGVCLTDSNVSITGEEVSGNRENGIRAESTELNLTNTSFDENLVDILLMNSNLSAERVELGATMINTEARSVALNQQTTELPKPSQAGERQLPLDLRFQVGDRAGNSIIESIGIHYPPNVTNEVRNMYLYKYDGDPPYNITKLGPLDRSSSVAKLEKDITNFSVFELYGVESEQQTNDTGGEGDDGQQGGGGTGETGSAGGGGSAGGVTDFDPVTQIPELNLSLESSNYDALRGETVSVDFSLNNTGNLSLNDVQVSLTNSSFPSVPRSFDNLNMREVRQGRVLLSVPEDAEPRNRTFEIAANYRNLTLDTELLDVNISELRQVKDLDLVESPSFVNFPPGESRYVGFLLENPTNRNLEGIQAEVRGEGNCVTLPDRNFSLASGERKNVQLQFQTSNTTEVCNSVIVFRHEGDILGYSPMRVVVERDEGEQALAVPLYFILLAIWTVLLTYRVIKNRRGE